MSDEVGYICGSCGHYHPGSPFSYRAVEQRNGISLKRVYEIAERVTHP